jgi:hypothetical protein
MKHYRLFGTCGLNCFVDTVGNTTPELMGATISIITDDKEERQPSPEGPCFASVDNGLVKPYFASPQRDLRVGNGVEGAVGGSVSEYSPLL